MQIKSAMRCKTTPELQQLRQSEEGRALIVSNRRRRPWCPGCGLHWTVYNIHRVDCTADGKRQISLILRTNPKGTPAYGY